MLLTRILAIDLLYAYLPPIFVTSLSNLYFNTKQAPTSIVSKEMGSRKANIRIKRNNSNFQLAKCYKTIYFYCLCSY